MCRSFRHLLFGRALFLSSLCAFSFSSASDVFEDGPYSDPDVASDVLFWQFPTSQQLKHLPRIHIIRHVHLFTHPFTCPSPAFVLFFGVQGQQRKYCRLSWFASHVNSALHSKATTHFDQRFLFIHSARATCQSASFQPCGRVVQFLGDTMPKPHGVAAGAG